MMFRFIDDNPLIARMRATERRRYGIAMQGFVRRQIVPLSLAFVCLALALLGSLIWGSRSDAAACAAASLLVTCIIVSMLAPFRSLGSTFATLTSERESGTYDSLLGTRLSPEEIAFGKLYVGCWPLLRELALIAPLVVGFGCCTGLSLQAVGYLACVTSFVIFFGCLGLVCSAFAKGTQRASRTGTLVACALVFGPVLANAFFPDLGGGGELVMLLSPLASTSIIGINCAKALTGTGLVVGLYGAAALVMFSETVRSLRARQKAS